MAELCRLCGKERPLLLSHIIPAFVFRWKRESAGGSPLRNTKQPNLRVQDGLKRRFLCAECEERFSRDEREFANKTFYPFVDDPSVKRAYGPSLLRFCASVSWRIVRLAIEDDTLTDMGPAGAQACRSAEAAWREFLLGERPHPGQFRQHVLPFDAVETISEGAAPNINRYLMRTIQMDLCHDSTSIFTFAKLGPIAIFGTVRQGSMPWKGTQIQANEGPIGGPSAYQVPGNLWHYLNGKARESALAMSGVSDVQRAKMENTLRENAGAFVGSPAFRALEADVLRFGDDAFEKPT